MVSILSSYLSLDAIVSISLFIIVAMCRAADGLKTHFSNSVTAVTIWMVPQVEYFSNFLLIQLSLRLRLQYV